MTLADAVRDIGQLPRKSVFYVLRDEASPDGSTEVMLVPSGERAPDGWTYLLELWIAQEVLQVWSAWRAGRVPTPAEGAEAVAHYAKYDAYQPVEAPRLGSCHQPQSY